MPSRSDLQTLIIQQQRHLQKLQEQAARLGPSHAPAHLLLDIEDVERELADMKAQLAALPAQSAAEPALEATPAPPATKFQPAVYAVAGLLVGAMAHPTIDREPAITLFDQIMQPAPTHRVLRLSGEAKMGKSHLLTKVFPLLAQQTYQTPSAVVDLRGSSVTVPDILHQCCAQLGGEARFPAYYAAYEAWLNRPVVEVKGLQALFSSLSIRAAEPEADARRVERQLTTKFVADLAHLAPQTILLMFDALEQSDNPTQAWLMTELLVGLTALEHVRVVVAGRAVPDAAGAYAARCHSCELTPVRDEAAYISYCQEHSLDIEEALIKGFANLLDYKPGLFVDMVLPKYGPKGAAHE